MGTSKATNSSLYSFRLLACVCVVLIHAPHGGSLGVLIEAASRWAVPFFFLTSGYFAYGSKQASIKRRGHKTLRLSVRWFVIYFCLNLSLSWLLGQQDLLLANFTDVRNWTLFLGCNWVTPFVGCGHLWYLFAMLYVYLVFSRLNPGGWVSKIPYIAGAAFVLDWVFQAANVFFVLGLTNVLWRNWLFEGLPFFLLGYWIAWGKDNAAFSLKLNGGGVAHVPACPCSSVFVS